MEMLILCRLNRILLLQARKHVTKFQVKSNAKTMFSFALWQENLRGVTFYCEDFITEHLSVKKDFRSFAFTRSNLLKRSSVVFVRLHSFLVLVTFRG